MAPVQVNGQRVNILVVLSIQLVQGGSTHTKESELVAVRVQLQVQANGRLDNSLEECLSTLEDRALLVGIFQEQLEDNTQEQPAGNIQERLEGSIQERPEDSIQERLEDNSLVEHIQELQDNFQEAPYPAGYPDTITLAPA